MDTQKEIIPNPRRGFRHREISPKPPDGLSIPVNQTSVVTVVHMFRKHVVLVLSKKK